MQEIFRVFAAQVSRAIGSLWSFLFVIILIVWSGFSFNFSSEWKSNVGFTISIISLSILIFLQKSQNHNDKATHLKLDELVNAIEGARNEVVAVENKAEKDIDELKESVIDALSNE